MRLEVSGCPLQATFHISLLPSLLPPFPWRIMQNKKSRIHEVMYFTYSALRRCFYVLIIPLNTCFVHYQSSPEALCIPIRKSDAFQIRLPSYSGHIPTCSRILFKLLELRGFNGAFIELFNRYTYDKPAT